MSEKLTLKNKYGGLSRLSNELTEAFIAVEYSRITPLFSPDGYSTPDADRLWQDDPIFHRRVDCMVAGVLQIVQKHVNIE